MPKRKRTADTAELAVSVVSSSSATAATFSYNRQTPVISAQDDFQRMVKTFVQHTTTYKQTEQAFTVPDIANILQVSREALYRICTVFVELAMMLQLTPTTYQWAVADTSEKVQVPSAAATAATAATTTTTHKTWVDPLSCLEEDSYVTNSSSSSSSSSSAPGNASPTQTVLQNITLLEQESANLDIYLAAAHHTMNSFVNHGDNAKYGCVFLSDIRTFLADQGQGSKIAFTLHGPEDCRIEVPHPDDYLPQPGGSSGEGSPVNKKRKKAENGGGNDDGGALPGAQTPPDAVQRRYQLYAMSRNGPFDINFIGKQNKKNLREPDTIERGRMFGQGK